MGTRTATVEPQRKGVDGGALIRAAVVASVATLLMYLYLVPVLVGAGNAAVILRYMASVVMGADVLPPPANLSPTIMLAALAVHAGISLSMAAVIAFILHRWGLLTGIIGGAVLGLVFFAIIHYSLTLIHPHFYAMNHWSVALVHAVFGAIAGGIYELYECEPGEQLEGSL
ncbi:MAG: hypothetical protein HKN35_10000 [Woeseia sp.]|nr:hypothetical protein [Woeseia sp.]NNE61217.1 hypothetical protein [Woeseia sp.]